MSPVNFFQTMFTYFYFQTWSFDPLLYDRATLNKTKVEMKVFFCSDSDTSV